MEITQLLNENASDLPTFLKSNGVKYRRYSQEKCYVLKMKNDEDYTEKWHRHCRGAVYNYETGRLNVLPPSKSREVSYECFSSLITDNGTTFTELYDGTMINVFYNNDKWNLSSRSTLGCSNRWILTKTYKELFDETFTLDYERLNKDYSYSFVLRNKKNRNISPIGTDEIVLVKIYDPLNNEDVSIDEACSVPTPRVLSSPSEMNMMDSSVKGYTVIIDNERFKCLTPLFKRMRDIKLNLNNKSLLYLELQKKGDLKEYLSYFPEDTGCFSETRSFVQNLTNELYDTYYSTYVKKENLFKDIKYEYKPLIKDIHGIYLRTRKKIRVNHIRDYLLATPSKRLIFVKNFSK